MLLKKHKQIISSALILNLVVPYFVFPSFANAQASSTSTLAGSSASTTALAASIYPNAGIPKMSIDNALTIPKIVINTSTLSDLSRINWDTEVQFGGEIVKISSDNFLNQINLDEDIKSYVRMYRSDVEHITNAASSDSVRKIDRSKEALHRMIAQRLIDLGKLPKNYFDLELRKKIDLSEKILDIKTKSKPVTDSGIIINSGVDGKIESVKKSKKISGSGLFTLASFSYHLQSTSTVPSSTQLAIQYLVDQQKINGSWGNTSSAFVDTVAVLDAFQTTGVTGSSTDFGIDWLDYSITDNNDFFAQKVKIQVKAGEPTTTADILAGYIDETNGGFGFDKDYQSDPGTTADVLIALNNSNYQDSGEDSDLTTTLTLIYLSQKQRFDGGWSDVEGGESSVALTAKIVEAILPWSCKVISGFGPQDIYVGDVVNKATSWLKNTQSLNGTWNNSLINTALAFYALKIAGETPVYENSTFTYLQNAQAEDGSFANGNIYVTAKALKALSMPRSMAGDLEITDIVPLGTLQTGVSTSIKILIRNNGTSAVSTGTLYLVTDGYVINSYQFENNGIVINPSETKEITLSFADTYKFVGDVEFIASLEGDGLIHAGSKYREILTFSADTTGLPGMPVYFVAQKYSFNNTDPAINVRWKQKNDSNRLYYMIMWRQFGSSTYTYVPVSSTWNGAWITPMLPDQLYEVTIGVRALDGTRFVYNCNPIQVYTSGDPNKYATSTLSGQVNYAGLPLSNASLFAYIESSGPSSAIGEFELTGVPYGRGAVGISDFHYDQYMVSYTNIGNSLSNFKVPTNLKFDYEAPTVTDTAIFGESDKVMPNKKTVTIQYSVDDDEKLDNIGYAQSATFSYYDPHDQNWHIIGTQNGPLYNTMTYNWYIPGELLGTGYQLQVSVRDYSGKETTSTPWGPFEITDGNAAPEFTFIAPSSLSSSEADLKYTIKWYAKDDEDNAQIYLYKDVDQNPNNGHNGYLGTFNENDFLQQYEWDTSSLTVGSYYIKAVVCDSSNPCKTVYSSKPVTIDHVHPLSPTELKVNNSTNPSYITSHTVNFSAKFNDPNGANDSASSYQIQVSTSSSFDFVKWDSLKSALTSSTPEGSRIEEIPYSGSILTNSTTYYWRIKLWDAGDDEGVWSTETSTFSISATSSCLYNQFSESGDGLWRYKKSIQIIGSESGALSNFSLLVTLDTASLVQAGKLQSSLADLRFADNVGAELPWWLESGANTTSTKIWVRLSSIPTQGTTIYAHYGNANALLAGGYANNGGNTFDFYDSFDDSSMNGSLWGVGQRYGQPSELGGKLIYELAETPAGQEILTVPAFSGTKIAEFNMSMDIHPVENWKSALFGVRIGSTSSVYWSPWAVGSSGWWSDGVQDCAAVNGGPYLGSVLVNPEGGTFMVKFGTTTCKTGTFSATTSPYTFDLAAEIGGGTSTVNIYDFRIRPYVSSPPVSGSVGTEVTYNNICVLGAFAYSGGGSWQYKKSIQVSGSNATQTAYAVPLVFDTGSLVSEGKLQSNLADLRFSDFDRTELPWWLESGGNSSSTKIWVKINSIPSSGTTIYLYYGNPHATFGGGYANNLGNTFDFYDNFEDSSLNGSLWGNRQRYDSPSEASGNLAFGVAVANTGSEIGTVPTFTGRKIAEFKMNMDIQPNQNWKSAVFVSRVGSPSSLYWSPWVFGASGWWSNDVQNCSAINGGPYLGSVLVDPAVGSYVFTLGTTTCRSASFSANPDPYSFGFSNEIGGGSSYVYFEDFRVRSIASPEPEMVMLGAEESFSGHAPLAATSLKVNGNVNPSGLTGTPRFSSVFNDLNSSDYASYYRIQVSTSASFSNVYWDSSKNLLVNSTTPGNRFDEIVYNGSALHHGITYYWRIKLWDAEDAEGPWSSVGNFSLVVHEPSPPSDLLTLGYSNPVGLTSTPGFSALFNDSESSDYAIAYRILVSTTSDFTDIKWDSGKQTVTNTTTVGSRVSEISYGGSALTLGLNYYWKIKFWDFYDTEGSWSTSTATFSKGDINSHSVSFNGSTQYAYNTSTGLNLTGSFTYEAYFNAANTSGHQAIVGDRLANNSVGETQLYIGNGHVFSRSWDSGHGWVTLDGGAISANTWIHVALVHGGSNHAWELYVNGTLVNYSDTALSLSNSQKIGLVLGAQEEGAVSAYFSGQIDEVRIWNTARTSIQINNNKNTQLFGNESGLMAYYKFNNSWEDSTSNGYILTTVNSPGFTTSIPSPNSHSVGFNGSNQYVYNTSTSLNLTGNFTYEATFKVTGSGQQNIVGDKYANNSIGDTEVYVNNGHIVGRSWSSGFGWLALDGGAVNNNTWYHVAFVHGGSQHAWELYLNGALVAYSDAALSLSNYLKQGLGIGAMDYGSGVGAYFNGYIDDVRVWNVARTSSQISSNKNIQLAGNETGLVAYYKFNNGWDDSTANGNNLSAVNSPTFSASTPF